IRDLHVTGVQTCALPISGNRERAGGWARDCIRHRCRGRSTAPHTSRRLLVFLSSLPRHARDRWNAMTGLLPRQGHSVAWPESPWSNRFSLYSIFPSVVSYVLEFIG